MKRIFYYRGILALPFQDISVFELFCVDQADHDPVHGVFHVRLKVHIIGINDLQIRHDPVIGAGVIVDHGNDAKHHHRKRNDCQNDQQTHPFLQRYLAGYPFRNVHTVLLSGSWPPFL